jgi:asparagine synthase (glutamine-hydrolysing)
VCGIAGVIDPQSALADPADVVTRMTTRLKHRGPDDHGLWLSPDRRVVLGHRRLSIIDLSASGHQPMMSASGRFTIVFNGEIYNFKEIRARLTEHGQQFRGHSDTEVLLAAIEQWGLSRALELSVGMFAFALWDAVKGELHLVRDRVGKKPLYFGVVGSCLVFSSELKALRALPGARPEIDRRSLALYCRLGYVPAPYTILAGIEKVRAACIVTVRLRSQGFEIVRAAPYWSPPNAQADEGRRRETSDGEAVDELARLLGQAVGVRLIADVPLGAFLSGGVDSSTVVSLMQAQSAARVKTFSIGFEERGFDEAPAARAVAGHLGTEHTELYVSPTEARDVIPLLPSMYDEPFADSSQIPTFLISRLARSQVTVSLSGDGGDELFGGYNRYLWGERIWSRSRWIPAGARGAIGRAMGRLSPDTIESLAGAVLSWLPTRYRFVNPVDKLYKFADAFGARSCDDMYRVLASHWVQPSQVVLGGTEPEIPALDGRWDSDDFVQRMMLMDLVIYLPDDILVKLDRASMAVSLEGRVPLLDHRVIEFALGLPLDRKIRNGEGKWILRQVLYRYVPESLVDRPKTGFSIPIDAWLRGPLREWANELLQPRELRAQGYLNAEEVARKWEDHSTGRRQWAAQLWDVLMFQIWLREYSSAA